MDIIWTPARSCPFSVEIDSMFGGTSNEGVWGFAALAQGVRGLGLGPNDVGQSRKPVDFGGWRGKVDEEPDSPEGKGAAPDNVPVVDEAQVGTC